MTTTYLRRPILLVALVVATLVAGAIPAGAAARYKVVYNITSANGYEGHPQEAPEGANIWTCRPSRAHPVPVVLVHGLGATMGENWNTISPLLADHGYCVYALTYGANPGNPDIGGVEPMEQSSAELASLVARVLRATHASKVDLVGHSEGTVMPQYYLKFRGGAKYVDKYVAITPLYQGTTFYGLAALDNELSARDPQGGAWFAGEFGRYCGSCTEFLSGSAFLKHLYADGVYAVRGVTYTAIMTEHDELVTPYTSGWLRAPNATDIVVQNQCGTDLAEHVAMAWDPVVAADVLNALDPRHPIPVPCTLVLPLYGAAP